MPTKYGLEIIDRELACAPFRSEEGRAYFAAMTCAANMAFANRQVILHRIREVLRDVFGRGPEAWGSTVVYDVAHNTAKLERHVVGGARARAARAPQGRDARLRAGASGACRRRTARPASR